MINANLLPKGLKRLQEPGYWRVLAVAFPLIVGAVLFGIQYLTNQTVANLERDVRTSWPSCSRSCRSSAS